MRRMFIYFGETGKGGMEFQTITKRLKFGCLIPPHRYYADHHRCMHVCIFTRFKHAYLHHTNMGLDFLIEIEILPLHPRSKPIHSVDGERANENSLCSCGEKNVLLESLSDSKLLPDAGLGNGGLRGDCNDNCSQHHGSI